MSGPCAYIVEHLFLVAMLYQYIRFLGFCINIDCNVNDCATCKVTRTCSQCERGYYVKDGDSCVSSYECERHSTAIATQRNGIDVCEGIFYKILFWAFKTFFIPSQLIS